LNVVSLRLNAYLKASPELRQLSSRAGELIALQQLYEQMAPASLLRYSCVLLCERQLLTLAAHNSAVAAKLRQLAPEFTRQFKNKGCEITGIKVKVQVTVAAPETIYSPPSVSAEGRKHLTELAVKLPDSPLKSAIARLAGNSVKQTRR
jgi:hypothetical protein